MRLRLLIAAPRRTREDVTPDSGLSTLRSDSPTCGDRPGTATEDGWTLDFGLPTLLRCPRAGNDFFSRKHWPVTEPGWRRSSGSVPPATSSPPCTPAPGPRSTI